MTEKKILILPFLFLFVVSPIIAQNSFEEHRNIVLQRQTDTRKQIENLEGQIANYRERLDYAAEREDQMYNQYEELTRLITLQEEKLRQMRNEQRDIRREITLVEENIVRLENRLENLIEEYKSTLTYIYKYGRTNDIALLLTSTSINQLLVRSYYLSRFDAHRKEQADEIKNTQQVLRTEKIDLEQAQVRNRDALTSIEREARELENREKQLEENIQLLRRDRRNFENQLAIFENQRNELNEALDQLMSEEAALRAAEEERQRRLAQAKLIEDEDERRAAIARYSTPILRESRVSDDELSAFSADFASQRGQLPWPIEDGVITERFGERVHPVFGTRTNNPGVNIAASPNSSVRVVNDGYVYDIRTIQGFGDVILVNHGTYNTAYGNLSSIYVRRNQVLQKGDVVGLSGDSDSPQGEVLFFLIRDGSQNVDPEIWLQRPLP